ncbi:MAG: hypothetical protein MUO31_02350, partial [Thermodesulfovibrionales bacterium]|nr:hypothetical protein [Thermodesulfovibrionales bacterium]
MVAKHNRESVQGEQTDTDQPGGGMPIGSKQIVDTVNNFMPIIEQVTGLTRREIFLQMMKTGAR